MASPHSSSPASSKNAVTLRHVAEEAGVSRMTVSRAFKEGASISPELRKKILKIAKEIGYAPDTMVSELMTSFVSRRPIGYQETFAAIWWQQRWKHAQTKDDFDAAIYRGLNEGAKIHGRKIDHFVLSKEMPARVINRMLHARNIQGVILTPPPSADIKAPKLDWDKLSTVIIGSTLREPKFHRAQASHYTAIIQVMNTLRDSGYKKPCLLLRSELEERMLHAYRSAFLGRGFPKKRIWHAESPSSEGLSEWLHTNKPDVIIADWDHWQALIPEPYKSSQFVSLAVTNEHGSISGIYQNPERMAQCSIDLLIRARLTHEMGIPSEPVLMLTSGTWLDRKTLQRDANAVTDLHV